MKRLPKTAKICTVIDRVGMITSDDRPGSYTTESAIHFNSSN
jgi:hypothetical protein